MGDAGTRLTEAQSQEALAEMKGMQTLGRGLFRAGDLPRALAGDTNELMASFSQFYAW